MVISWSSGLTPRSHFSDWLNEIRLLISSPEISTIFNYVYPLQFSGIMLSLLLHIFTKQFRFFKKIFVFFTQVSERGKNQTCEWPIRLHHGCDKSTLGPVQNLRLPTFSLPLLLKNRNLLPAPHAYVTGKFVYLTSNFILLEWNHWSAYNVKNSSPILRKWFDNTKNICCNFLFQFQSMVMPYVTFESNVRQS